MSSPRSQNPNPRESLSFFGSDDFNPFEFLQAHLASRRASGVNFEFIIEGGNIGNSQLPSNIGDYFIGPGFEELIQHLAENDPNRYGTPPASKSAVEELPNLKVDEELLRSELAQCAVCKDDFELGLDVKQMPCKETMLVTRMGMVRLREVEQMGEGLLRYRCHGLWGVLDHYLAREEDQIRLKVTWHPCLQLVSCMIRGVVG
ncbi:hypothetical protein K7X08_031300 [Anisodus acutangulus]|uniref:Uncharacterized protein n=1 Tax=Anisodus acutangulus TaxID=402998 RepID=A0A9Q1RJ71_9SOLA|nr:hypothetical protein K7X08_031300 [Anisodus acutangulus]